jgi:hypothetical protein
LERESNGKIDANALLQAWVKEGVSLDEQKAKVQSLLRTSRPLISIVAERVGEMEAQDKPEGAKVVIELLKTMEGTERDIWLGTVAKTTGLNKADLAKSFSKNGKKHDSDDDEGEPIFSAGGWIQKHLVELLYDPERMRTAFCVRFPDGKIEEWADKVVIEGRKYVPIPPNSTLKKKVVLLPKEMGERLQEAELLDVVRNHIHKYFDFGSDSFFEELSPLYVLFTYLYDAFMEVSYLRGLGDYGTGKTRFLKAVGKICYRPVYMSGGSSAATIYSLLDIYHGTLVLNEADFEMSDESSIIAKILNGGTEKDEGITRMRGSMEKMDVEAFNVFGPKVIVTRKSFNDRAIESRCLTMDMVPFIPHPRIQQSLPPEFDVEAMEIRNLLTTFRMHQALESITIDQSKSDRSLEPRLNQVTLSLLSTVKQEATKEKIQAFLREYNQKTREERKESMTARVLEGLMMAYAWGPVSDHPADLERVYLKDVASAVNFIMDDMRKRMGEDEEEDNPKKPKKTTSRGVSGILRKFCQLRVRETTDGADSYRGTNEVVWEAERIEALCERWAVDPRKRGSMKRPVVIDFNKNSPGLDRMREEWNNTRMEDE